MVEPSVSSSVCVAFRGAFSRRFSMKYKLFSYSLPTVESLLGSNWTGSSWKWPFVVW